jgi:predicted GIY-YIG superfamily endonuclease
MGAKLSFQYDRGADILYISDLARRVYEHKHRLVPGFTSKYRVSRLVY